MHSETTALTPTEWYVMECLWKQSPCTGREAVEHLEKSVGWSRSTTLTMLRRMTEKGLIRCDTVDGLNTYIPLIAYEDAVQQETKSFLRRVYHGNVSMLVSAITQKQELSKEELQELYDILEHAKEAK